MAQAWYPFYWSDYSGKTLHLTQAQHGAYFLLLRYIYTTEKPIPHPQRYRIAQALLEQERVDTDVVLGEFFERRGEFWYNSKADKVITKANARHQVFVKAGQKGGKKRKRQA